MSNNYEKFQLNYFNLKMFYGVRGEEENLHHFHILF